MTFPDFLKIPDLPWPPLTVGTMQVIFTDPRELQVTWRCVYNEVVWLYESYFRTERYLQRVVEGSDLYKYIIVGQ